MNVEGSSPDKENV
ncbi:Protein of unknown function [Bacillus cereus]|nr:Protein of unknown function [Bacillus cereus]